MYIKVKDADDKIMLTAPKQMAAEAGHTVYDVGAVNYKAGGTYDGTTYTAPTADTTASDRDASWKAAQADLVGADPNDIAGGTDKWKKCVRFNAPDCMEAADWTALQALY